MCNWNGLAKKTFRCGDVTGIQSHFAQQSKMNKFKIEVVQPMQSPDLNVDDLAFSGSLNDVSLVAKEKVRSDRSSGEVLV